MTESRTTISIIIPAYNRAKLLPECIKSIIHQTYTDWECIIVDDFSTDNTRELVEKINVADKRIRCITNTEKKEHKEQGIPAYLKLKENGLLSMIQMMNGYLTSLKNKLRNLKK